MTDSVNEQIVLETARLRLRQWRLSDYKPFAALNADPEVMRCVGPPLSEQESNQLARRMEDAIAQRGWGLWAVELLSNGRFIGCAGLNPLEARFPCGPGVEVGWRLARLFWGRGYGREAANAALHFAFDTLALDEVLALSALQNKRSLALMRHLGMQNTRRTLAHPALPVGNPLRSQALYRISQAQWRRLDSEERPVLRQLSLVSS